MTDPTAGGGASSNNRLFWTSFVALIATAFGFIVRINLLDTWAEEFGLSDTQKGEIFGVGLWPFAISIVLISLVIDKIGYGRALLFAFICHVLFGVLTLTADGYQSLYLASFIGALGNGAVEAAINPLIANVFREKKTKWLNMLHAGWPGGLVLAGLLAISMDTDGIIGGMVDGPISWQVKVGLIFLPVAAYGVMMIGIRFPASERITAGVPYKSMLNEAGLLGTLVVASLMAAEVSRVFELGMYTGVGIVVAILALHAMFARSPGQPLFLLLVLVMIPLAITELGTDSWITPLLEPEMDALGGHAMWVLVYTSAIMMILRFCAGPIVHKLSPLGLLATSSAIAIAGLFALSSAVGMMIFAAATLYAFGKTFFWPTMLGVVAERFPKGGALTLNSIAGVGMLGVGIVGTPLLGNIQDKQTEQDLLAQKPAIHAKVVGEEKRSVFGTYQPIDTDKVATLSETEKQAVTEVQNESKRGALRTVTVFPMIMLVSYIGLILWFRSKGGYRVVQIDE